jgi:phosphohistidine phosphatase
LKSILLIRHAKSSWSEPSLNDFDRTLNERGKNDAPMMAKRLVKKKIKIDAFITSPAKRAKKTAEIFSKEFGGKKGEIILADELYGAMEDAFYNVISNLKNKYDQVAIFSHNPGITDFANVLTDVKIDNMPTCSIFAIKIDSKDWSDFKNATKEFWFFDYPKSP